MKVRFHYGYPIDINIDTDKQVDVYIDQFETTPVPEGHIRIVVQEDPRSRCQHTAYAYTYPDAYTHLLTMYQELLGSIPKAIRWNMPTTWIHNYTFPQKTFSVSTVVGGKQKKNMTGYKLRHDVWKSRHLIKIPKRFYLSGNAPHFHKFVPWRKVNYKGELVLGASKEPLFDSQFHIAIENTPICNYFSEKLLDCFRTKTVPIYSGCTNIGSFFNTNGIIVVKNVRDIVRVCNGLTAQRYADMMGAIEDNYVRSFDWIHPWERLERKVRKLIQ